MFSSAVRVGTRLNAWKVKPILSRRSSVSLRAASPDRAGWRIKTSVACALRWRRHAKDLDLGVGEAPELGNCLIRGRVGPRVRGAPGDGGLHRVDVALPGLPARHGVFSAGPPEQQGREDVAP